MRVRGAVLASQTRWSGKRLDRHIWDGQCTHVTKEVGTFGMDVSCGSVTSTALTQIPHIVSQWWWTPNPSITGILSWTERGVIEKGLRRKENSMLSNMCCFHSKVSWTPDS